MRNHLYYLFKPYLPWQLRFALRRLHAKRLRTRSSSVWPILEEAGRRPKDWLGWPDGKRFGFVITHDVESRLGILKCRGLADLDREMGFRSSFNFVPEGDYAVPEILREELARQGFEIGVHDLNHDGKLFRSRKTFGSKAERINRYLREWGAVGFRAGLMHHNYEWFHDLDIQYDATSFDTDPFEPQPDGVGTIFPFRMRNEDGRHYLEFPYTLAQDSTLFLLFRQRGIELWKHKLDWIVRQGGMALVNVHPDYLQFPGEASASHTYPSELYRQLLQYVRERYEGQYWHGVPRDLAAVCRDILISRSSRRRRRVAMVTASVYERDNRVLRYAQTLAGRGDTVEILALAHDWNAPRRERIGEVDVTRFGVKASVHGVLPQMWVAALFLLRTSLHLTSRHLRHSYDLVHVHNMPDFLVFAAWLPRWTGAAVILDVHDIFPEFYATRFGSKKTSLSPCVLKWIERRCAQFASHVIVSNHLWRDTLVSRSVSADRCSVFINSVDTDLFAPVERTRNHRRRVIIYPGSFNRHQGLDLAIAALAQVRQQMPDVELHLYGMGPAKGELVRLCFELDLTGVVHFHRPVPLDEMPSIIANADLGIVPKRASDFFGNQAFSTKIMEFMSQGLPVVVSRTLIDTYYYNDNEVRFFDSEDVPKLAEAIVDLLQDDVLRKRYAENGRAFVAKNCWAGRQQEYLDLVDSLAP